MTKQKFISILKAAMIETAKGRQGDEFTCNILHSLNYSISEDYKRVYGYEGKYTYHIPVCFITDNETDSKMDVGNKTYISIEEIVERRLNALSMYMAQGLAFGTYSEMVV